ncbi:Uncharacterised protein [Legionella sainthelensi]|uniref:hypothetical protein n=1 Tax=Legionella sainthelensi TaxID=28087 RepID=UPI000F6DD226|nr:hypothetical protein [Legionella sainthelensi]VEB35933.1 Uncharacterised protein [Legionella sainthelensi]
MPNQPDKLLPLKEKDTLLMRSNPNSIALRVVVITNNPSKFAEFKKQLGDGYGMDIHQWKTDQNTGTEESLADICQQIMLAQRYSPHFILKEDSTLVARSDGKDLTTLPLEQLKELSLESVIHTSNLKVMKPQWEPLEFEGKEQKRLTGFSLRHYEKRSYGYIQEESKIAPCKLGFGWDSYFVNAATNLTNEEFYEHYGKISARQHTISDFIESYLRYKTLLSLKHHQLPLSRPIEFGEKHFSVRQFIEQEQHLSNPHVSDWGIDKLRAAVLNEGLFFKAAWSRPVKNYFSPPFSGLPLTAKKDEAEETIFMQHDMLHHLVCDLICDVPLPSKLQFYVYSSWRMLSEACTLVLADMLYADGLIKSGVERSCVDKRIYPLFECIKKVQNVVDPKQMAKEDKIEFIKKLLSANSHYALLGDDSQWKALLTQSDGTIKEEHLLCLKAYKDHFGKFFIGDNAWTRANFDNMQKESAPLARWIDSVGRDQFKHAHIPLLSEITQEVKEQEINEQDYAEVFKAVFNIVFNTKIKPYLEHDSIQLENNEVLQSRAFRRFLIGQVSLIGRYPTPLNLDHISKQLFTRIQDQTPFSNQEQDKIRNLLKQYILGLEGLRLMSREEALNAIDCSPVFPPVYISYQEMQAKYETIANCVAETIYHHDGFDNQSPKLNRTQGTFFNQHKLTNKKKGIEDIVQDDLKANSVLQN